MDVRGSIDENAVGFFDALRKWVAIPSISADPADRADVRRSAEWLAACLRRSGFPVAEIWETGAAAYLWAELAPAAGDLAAAR
jgi:acetylornithine deacetylase/succinyl-diaminopimelate desuccinylase-like protein